LWKADAPVEPAAAPFPAAAAASLPPGSAGTAAYRPDAQWLAAAAKTAPAAAPAVESPRLWPIILRGLLRMVLLLLLGGAVFAAVRILDGASIARRERLLLAGKPVWGTVQDIQAEPSLGQLLYRVSFIYPSPEGPMRAQALAGEGVFGRLARGNRVALRVASEQPGGVCLEEDFGYSAERGALLLAALALLIVGGWSFIFRVL